MNRAGCLVALVIASITLAGCQAPMNGTQDLTDPGGPETTSTGLSPHDLARAIDTEDFFVITAHRDNVSLLAQGFDVDDEADTLDVYYIDADRQRHVESLDVTIPARGAEILTSWQPPGDAAYPVIVKPQCACWISLAPRQVDESLLWGADDDVVRHWENFTAIWPDPYDPVEDPMYDVKEVTVDANLIGVQVHWSFNLDGHSSVTSPSGMEVVYMEGNGRSITSGHASLGYRPLEPGNWTFDLHGEGWVAYEFTYVQLTEAAFAKYGVSAQA